MERDDFLKALHQNSVGVEDLLSSAGQEWLARLVADGSDEELGRQDIDRIYELLCYFSFLHELSGRVQDLRCVEAPGENGYRLPYGPGKKENFAYFRFEVDGLTFDLCCGTGVPSRDGPEEHPDVSLQAMDGPDDESLPGSLVGLWDAKYHRRAVTKPDMFQVCMWCSMFEIAGCAAEDLLDRLFATPLHVCGLLSNAKSGPDDYGSLLLKHRCSMTLEYTGPGTGREPSPSRSEHETHASQVQQLV